MSNRFLCKPLSALLLFLTAALPAETKAENNLYEIKVGILDHDVSGVIDEPIRHR